MGIFTHTGCIKSASWQERMDGLLEDEAANFHRGDTPCKGGQNSLRGAHTIDASINGVRATLNNFARIGRPILVTAKSKDVPELHQFCNKLLYGCLCRLTSASRRAVA